jgi:two-component system sensor histidine kinase UhpB
LRIAVLASIFLALLVSAAVAGAVSVLHARHSVALELRTALDGARHTAEDALVSRAMPNHPLPEDLTALFRSDRHVQAAVFDVDGKLVSISQGPKGEKVPAWLSRLLDPRLAAERLPVEDGVLELRPTAANEIAEVWTQFKDALLFLLTFSALVFLLVSVSIARTLGPLEDLSRAFLRLGEGRYDVRLRPALSSEVRRLSEGFNAMVGRLVEAHDRNARLEQQLVELQEEERADLAADLHDEIGPHLFAANMDAEAIIRLARTGQAEAVVEPARAIRDSVQHIQRHVRDMLRRLKPTRAVELGLEPALRELVSFWQPRRPDIAFELEFGIDDDAIDAAQRETLYRVAQEAVSNAVRHGKPKTVHIALSFGDAEAVVLQVDDDGVGAAAAATAGFGVAGMRQRMAGLGGELDAGPGPAGGWRVRALAPSPAG